jgi:hypothetical protein
MITYLMTGFPAGYEVPAVAGLAGDRGLQAARRPAGGTLNVFGTSADAVPPLHVHDREDECSYILDGAERPVRARPCGRASTADHRA